MSNAGAEKRARTAEIAAADAEETPPERQSEKNAPAALNSTDRTEFDDRRDRSFAYARLADKEARFSHPSAREPCASRDAHGFA